MTELAQTVTPQGVIAVCEFVDVPLDKVGDVRLAAVLRAGGGEQVVVVGEVVPDGPDVELGLVGDVAQRGPLDPVVADQTEEGVDHDAAALLRVDQLRHSTILSHLC
jgi:hypothetical protein